MIKKQDDLALLKKNKTGVKFQDLVRILKQRDWAHQSTNGSHYIFCKAGFLPIMIVKPHGNHKFCHPMDVNKVIAVLESESQKENDG